MGGARAALVLVLVVVAAVLGFVSSTWVRLAPPPSGAGSPAPAVSTTTVVVTRTVTARSTVTVTRTVTVEASPAGPGGGPGAPRPSGEGRFGILIPAPLAGESGPLSLEELRVVFEREAERAREVGASWVRPHPAPIFNWGNIDRGGSYDWSAADLLVRTVQEKGLKLLVQVWDCKRPVGLGPGGPEEVLGCSVLDLGEEDLERFARWLGALVERYDGDGVGDMPGLREPVLYYEILNEPIQHSPVEEADKYARILRRSYEAVKKACPEARVLVGGLLDVGRDLPLVLERCGDCFDVVSWHQGDAKMADKILRKLGVKKPMWVTEAWYEEPGRGARDERREALWMVEFFARSFAYGVDKIFHVEYPRLRGRGEKPKPAYFVYRFLSSKIGGFESARVVDEGRGLYEFRVGGVYRYVILRPAGLKLSGPGSVKVVSLLPKEGRFEERVLGLDGVLAWEEPVMVESEKPLSFGIGPAGPPPPPGGHPPPRGEEIKVVFTNSSYKYVESPPPGGRFVSGEEADIVLGWFGFDESGGPLTFNHPMGLASDGKRLVLADTRNNRVLLWDHLPTGNEPPSLVLGQRNFSTCRPGSGRGELRWPVDVAIAKNRIVVADTFNDRLLIWDGIPEENGAEADIVIRGFGDGYHLFSWGVWTDGEMLLATNTWHGAPVIYVWKSFPREDDQKPDMIIENPDFGTPRGITTDGRSYLIVSDHNPNPEKFVEPGMFVWHRFPEKGESWDAFIVGLHWNVLVVGDDLYASDPRGELYLIRNFRRLRGIVRIDDVAEPLRGTMLTGHGGDGSDAVFVGNITYLSLYNGARIVGYFGRLEDRPPDFAIGSDDPLSNPLVDKYFFIDNPVPVASNRTLVVISGFSPMILVYKRIPDESGALPDIVYRLPFVAKRGAYWRGTFYFLVGHGDMNEGILVWDEEDLREGRGPRAYYMAKEIKSVDLNEVMDLAVDGRYFYLVGKKIGLYVYRQPFTAGSAPVKRVNVSGVAVSSNGRKLAVACGGVCVLDVDAVLSENPGYVEVKAPSNDVFVSGDKLFTVDMGNNVVLVFDLDGISGSGGKTKVKPEAVIGSTSYGPEGRPEEAVPQYTRAGLFWPGSVWYNGFLWVGEYKFSGRLLRYSPRG